ncbi:MAG: hypothetical protein HZB38_15020 [Planctomycetes bacterium]|nr:hypothetical protein [Planctomycetota bacterium]
MSPSRVASILASAVLASGAAVAGPVTWSYDISTTGQDVFWNSPSAADPAAAEYDFVSTVTRVDATVQYSVFPPVTVDITGQIPPEYLSSSGTLYGPPPHTIVNQHVLFPHPPDPIAVAGDLLVTMDASGFGHVSFTNIQFGTYQMNLPPFGYVTVTIRGLRVRGTVQVTPVFTGDLDRDGDVDLQDLAGFLAAFGSCAGDAAYNPAADFDASGCMELQDLASLLANFGRA